MIRLYMKEEFVAKKERVIVKNESGEDVFLIVGKWGRIGDSLSLYAMNGSLLVEVKQVSLSLLPKFDLYVHQKKIGTITKHMGIRQPYFKVSGLNWTVSGDFISHVYSIKKFHQTIMEMEKASLSFGDFYMLEVTEPHYAPICAAISLIVDHYAKQKKQSKWRLAKKQKVFQLM